MVSVPLRVTVTAFPDASIFLTAMHAPAPAVDAAGTVTFASGDTLAYSVAANSLALGGQIAKDGALIGPPKSEHVLEGIRYDLLRELCEEAGIGYSLRPVAEGEVATADELLLSSSTKEVLPVTRLDGELVGHGALRGKPGPVYARLYEAYQRAKRSQCT